MCFSFTFHLIVQLLLSTLAQWCWQICGYLLPHFFPASTLLSHTMALLSQAALSFNQFQHIPAGGDNEVLKNRASPTIHLPDTLSLSRLWCVAADYTNLPLHLTCVMLSWWHGPLLFAASALAVINRMHSLTHNSSKHPKSSHYQWHAMCFLQRRWNFQHIEYRFYCHSCTLAVMNSILS